MLYYNWSSYIEYTVRHICLPHARHLVICRSLMHTYIVTIPSGLTHTLCMPEGVHVRLTFKNLTFGKMSDSSDIWCSFEPDTSDASDASDVSGSCHVYELLVSLRAAPLPLNALSLCLLHRCQWTHGNGCIKQNTCVAAGVGVWTSQLRSATSTTYTVSVYVIHLFI